MVTKTIPVFEPTGATRFLIEAKHPFTGDQKRFIYDTELNMLQSEDGHVFRFNDRKVAGHISEPFSKDEPLRKSRHIRRLKIQLGLSCNYSCDYCSQRFVERPKETNKKDIDDFVKKLDALEFSEEAGLVVELWGGEPFVYWKTIKPLVAAIKQKFAAWKKKPQFSVITNGSILTPEISYWLLVNNFSVSISHDGPGQHVRGPDPLDDPEQREVILDLYHALKPMGRFSFNAMLTRNNYSRKEIHDWFVKLTGDEDVVNGEGSLVDAYDDGGRANMLQTKAEHFAFRKQAYLDIFTTDGNVGFAGIVGKINTFTESVLNNIPASSVGQKCGMDSPDVIAVDLRGNVITCQNVSAVETAPNGESHLAGTLDDFENVRIKSSTHWRNRPSCASCPVLHLCKGSCMFNEGENWNLTCNNAYSDNIVLFALSFQKITGGYVPGFIQGGDLPPERRDIWGGVLEHEEEQPKRKMIPIKIVPAKTVIDGQEVYEKSVVK